MIPLTVGTEREDADEPAVIDGSRFNRHTFWCGQSGSGKTYALGVVLEQLVLETELPVAVLDPNADYVRLSRHPGGRRRGVRRALPGSRHPGAPQQHGRGGAAPHPLRRSHGALAGCGRAARPDRGRGRVQRAAALEQGGDGLREGPFLAALMSSGDPAQRRLGLRIDNLEILDWPLWAFGGVCDGRPR